MGVDVFKCLSEWKLVVFISSVRQNSYSKRISKDKENAQLGYIYCMSVKCKTLWSVADVQPTGYFDRRRGRFRNVPEMIPEFIVPDLTDFPVSRAVVY